MAKQSDFKATEFVGNPEIQEFKETNICKDDLKYIAKTFNISFKPDLRKDELRALILAHLGDKDVLEASRSLQTSDPNLLLELEKYVKLIPTFPDSDPESFFREFESTALHFEIPKPDWVWLIKPKLSDKALKYQTYHEFASEKLRGLKRWLKSASVNTFDELVNVIALEEFIRKIPYSIKMHLIDRGENDLIKAAQLADVFSLVHRSPTRERRVLQHNVKSNSGFKDGELVDQSNLKTNLTCSFCKRRGHHIKQCPDPKCKVSQTTAPSKPVAAILSVPTSKTADIFQPFRSLGAVSLEDGGKVHPIRIVRDTAAAQTVILKSSVPGIDSNYTGESVYLHDFNSQFPLRLARVHLSCGIVQGPVTVAVSEQPSLPIRDCSLLLGNDIAGGLVQTPAPIILSDTPLTHNPTDELEREQPNLFPSCAVTRSQKLKDTPTHSPLPPPSAIPQIFTEQSLLEAQQNDTTLTPLHSKVVPKEDILHPPSFYYHDNILMRLYRPPQLSDDDTWAECHQIVLPTSLRTPIMEVAHQGLSGHLGIRKTYLRLLNEFYWPGMKKDVAEFVKNCHPCQIVGKPNETIPPYPLQPIKNISAKTVANTLTNLFTTFGIPEEIQSDRGSNFTSVLFAEVLKLLGIKQTLSTAYHPQSQGALERFHQTMKSMIRKFCCEEDRDWDEGLQFLLFAIRETPSESLGVSPFELLFGRKVRGPLKVIKDHLISLPSTKLVTVNNYITSLKSNLDKVRSFAKTNLAHAQSVMKTNFDSKALVREFKEGDLVLAYIPISGSPLSAKYHGPYKISKKLSDSNYVISTPDRRKATQHIHVNLIKPYKTTSPLLDYEKQVLAVNTVPNVMSHTPNNAMYINFDKILPNIDSHPTDNSHILGNLVPYLSHLTNEHANDNPPQKREQMRSEVNFLLDHGLASPSQSPWASPCLLVPKEGGQLLLCTDYRRVNSITVPDAYPLPRVDDLIDEVDAVLSRLCQANLTVKLSKTSFGKATVTYLGHEVGQGIVRPKTANISAVMEYPVPATRKALMRFLGMAEYYQRFCPNFAEAALPLTKLTSGSVPYKWTQNCQAAFEHLKAMLTRDPVLRSPDFTKPFVLHTDASDVAIGAVLLQENTDTLHPVAYFSAKLDVHQLNYSTVEKELLAIVAAIKKFECYLQPSIKPLKIYSDHNPLTFLHRNKTSNQRMLRWSLLLQPFNIDIHHITGSQNVLADTLSRI
ncbi:uncharacterized protein LOC143034680 [Oratosquilla oratoria]|uniref:uncharacterized protein LOC143034680 n=1 Tax=Oratosquilla oratoria TaxID=337810 RepID=UPI003F76E2F8